MKSWKTTLVGSIAGILFILSIVSLVFDTINITEFAAINSSVGASAIVVLGILSKDHKNTD